MSLPTCNILKESLLLKQEIYKTHSDHDESFDMPFF